MTRALGGHAGALLVALFVLAGCGTDCDDAIAKLGVCELPTPPVLEGECSERLACQARCVRDTSCDAVALSLGGTASRFDDCTQSCEGNDLSGSLGAGGDGGGAAGGGGAGGG